MFKLFSYVQIEKYFETCVAKDTHYCTQIIVFEAALFDGIYV